MAKLENQAKSAIAWYTSYENLKINRKDVDLVKIYSGEVDLFEVPKKPNSQKKKKENKEVKVEPKKEEELDPNNLNQ
jgi:hypothetical protein